jgi:pyruvate/2-oxoglutarate dehydrogenase complex dihydrolipoamide dehydrogenase (E3) component
LASAATQLGVKVCLIDKNMLGGDCLHYGCVPSKTLIKTAKLAYHQSIAADYGLISNLQPHKWEHIIKRISDVQSHIQMHDHPDRFRAMGCEVIFGKAQFLNAHTVNISLSKTWEKFQPANIGTDPQIQLTAKKITIATGSKPRIPDIPGLKEAGFITNEHIFRLREQPRKLVIIGGGIISAELAQALNRLGTKVTILEKHEKFLGKLDPDVAAVITEKLIKEGVEIITQAQPQKVTSQEFEKQVEVLVGETVQTITADQILVAAGRQPNLDLGLATAGISTTEKGIKVNKKLKTSKANITAIGDVNGQLMFTHAANYEAGIVLSNEILRLPFKQKVDPMKIGWTIFTDPEIAHIGHDEASATKARINYTVAKFELAKNDRAQAEKATEGFVKVILKGSTIIGAQIVAPRAGEMIREWQMAIENHIPLTKIARSTYIYPTFGEASKWTASTHYAGKLFSPKVKSWLRFLFHYRGKS